VYNLDTINNNLESIEIDTKTGKIAFNDILGIFNVSNNNINTYYKRLSKRCPELVEHVELIQINGKGRTVRAIDLPSAVGVVWMLPGKIAMKFRRHSANYMIRLMSGDRSLIDEIDIQHERVSPETREVMLTNIEAPQLPQVSVVELQNIINHHKNNLETKEQLLSEAKLSIQNLTSKCGALESKNIRLVKQTEQTIKGAKDWHLDCEMRLQRRISPSDKVAMSLSTELSKSIMSEYEAKMDKIETDTIREDHMSNMYKQLEAANALLKQRLPGNGDECIELIKNTLLKYEKDIRYEHDEMIESLVEQIKKLECKCKKYKECKIASDQKSQEFKEEVIELQDTVTELKCKVKRLDRKLENKDDKNVRLKQKTKSKDKIISVFELEKKREKLLEPVLYM
jgi:hypothetical protein